MTDFRHERGLIHIQLRVKQGILTPFLLSGAASLSFSFAFGTFILRFASPDDNVSYQIFAFVVIPEISHNDISYVIKKNAFFGSAILCSARFCAQKSKEKTHLHFVNRRIAAD